MGVARICLKGHGPQERMELVSALFRAQRKNARSGCTANEFFQAQKTSKKHDEYEELLPTCKTQSQLQHLEVKTQNMFRS